MSTTGIEHVVIRGANKQIIFEDEMDKEYFLKTVKEKMTVEDVRLLAWCLMSNHAHLLLRALGNLGRCMGRINISYAEHFNHRHERGGHLFQDRFRSEPVEDEIYLKTVVRYIHRNPIKAGLFEKCEDYYWSSYCEYTETPILCDTSIVIGAFGSVDDFIAFHQADGIADSRIPIDEKPRFMTDTEALRLVNEKIGEGIWTDVLSMGKMERDAVIREMRRLGLSTGQIQRLTGISINIIRRC